MPTRDEILGRKEERAVPFRCEWGDIYLLKWNGKERRDWDYFCRNQIDDVTGEIRDPSLWRSTLVQMSVCDESGVLTFSASDVDALQKRAADVQEVICVAAAKLNKLSRFEAQNAGFFLNPSTGKS